LVIVWGFHNKPVFRRFKQERGFFINRHYRWEIGEIGFSPIYGKEGIKIITKKGPVKALKI
jgi:hypothetical protein